MMIWVNLFIVTLLKILIFWFWYIAWYKLKLFGNLGSWNKKNLINCAWKFEA